MQQARSMESAGAASLALETLPPPVAGSRRVIADIRSGPIAFYGGGEPVSGTQPPLLLVHSVNAAATAYEMRPLFDHYLGKRPVYALDLPGFGLSDRSDRKYTPRLMTDAVLAAIGDIQSRHDNAAVDVVALSLGCEFAARAATEAPNAIRTVALISPTGFDRRAERAAQVSSPGRTLAMPWLHVFLSFPLWKRGFFSALTSRASIRFFLQKTWGAKDIDEGLLEYDYLTTHQPGAENAPYYFVSGYLFSTDAMTLYRNLSMPVWMSHGVRGDFVDYEQKRTVQRLPNWSFDVFQTGAMPHFEKPAEFVSQYEVFLSCVTST
ncbi:alpha/beta fold hydrolase [Bradyrhizobium jicamae]|uniref:alpha/beta fold hydrolase n=1 Tax=Bradyrhizobium jicamae TaxID=280332 RepID=UPI001BA44A4B|nr:alpha/beta hydrolase [Bradyrhizobium jicamae]MBR0934199.1 alpha/beta hydrolase [Bradyrhizobium jicamae]